MKPGLPDQLPASDEPLGDDVTVVITTYNHAHFLADAIASALDQTRPPRDVLVVDDGSHDDPASVVARFPGVTFLSQANAGLAAARNFGLARCTTRYVIFLDADDRLNPVAIERSLDCLRANPGSAFVAGGHRRVDAALRPIGSARVPNFSGHPFQALLGTNVIGMHAAVMYDRAVLSKSGGFDPALKSCEDYDVYLRLSRAFPVAAHDAVVADYRIVPGSMSDDPGEMLRQVLLVHQRYRPDPGDAAAIASYRAGRRAWRRAFALAAWRGESQGRRGPGWRGRLSMAQLAPGWSLLSAAWSLVPRPVRSAIKKLAGRSAPPVGRIDLGDLASDRPVSRNFGYDRGTPLDRVYIERFLATHTSDIRGRALEIGDAAYCRRFGSGVIRQDVLHVNPDAPGATIVGDLAHTGVLPIDTFDCEVITQTIQFIFDMKSAVAELHRALVPGGVLLATVPGVSSVDRGEWGDDWCWSLTDRSARKLFEEVFGPGNVEVSAHGNVYAATCFLQGLAAEEADPALLERDDPAYPLVVCIRARRNG